LTILRDMITINKFRRILNEEAKSFFKEASDGDFVDRAWSAAEQGLDTGRVSPEEDAGHVPGPLNLAGGVVGVAVSGLDPASQNELADEMISFFRSGLVPWAVAAGATAKLPGWIRPVVDAARIAARPITGAAVTATETAIAAAGGGAAGAISGVIAPVALATIATYLIRKTTTEGWVAYKTGNQQAEINARRAFTSAVIKTYTRIVTRAMRMKTLKREELLASGAGKAVEKYSRSEALSDHEKALVAFIFSGADESDISHAKFYVYGFAPKIDSINPLVAPMQVKADKIFHETVDRQLAAFIKQVRQFQAGAREAAAQMRAKHQEIAKIAREQDAIFRERETQKIVDRIDFEQGRMPANYKPVPPGTAAAKTKSAGAPAPAAPKK